MNERAQTYGVILAGGASRRMGGADKGALRLDGKRLFDHVYAKLAPQVTHVLISGAHDYGAGLNAVPDDKDGPAGPAAGLFAITLWLKTRAPEVRRFLTAPVDAPLLPSDLAVRLMEGEGSTVVRCAGRIHPTFGCWDVNHLHAYFKGTRSRAPALHEIARSVSAREVAFETAFAFTNINTPEDLKEAEAMAGGSE